MLFYRICPQAFTQVLSLKAFLNYYNALFKIKDTEIRRTLPTQVKGWDCPFGIFIFVKAPSSITASTGFPGKTDI